MPFKPKKPCNKSGCPELTHERYCEKHYQEKKSYYNKVANSKRPKGYQKQYGRQWRKLRELVLQGEPLCRKCSAIGTEVDHIKPLSDGGTNELNNLQALCKSCHSHKTATENGGFGITKRILKPVER